MCEIHRNPNGLGKTVIGRLGLPSGTSVVYIRPKQARSPLPPFRLAATGSRAWAWRRRLALALTFIGVLSVGSTGCNRFTSWPGLSAVRLVRVGLSQRWKAAVSTKYRAVPKKAILSIAGAIIGSIVLTIALDVLFALDPKHQWATAVQASATLILVGVTGVYVWVTYRQMQLQATPLVAIRLAAQEQAARKAVGLLQETRDRGNDLIRHMPPSRYPRPAGPRRSAQGRRGLAGSN